jgi:hypothetical protein
MKQIIFLLVLSFLSLGIFAQEKSPKIHFKTTVHDFGDIKEEGNPATTSFELVNAGDAPLIISKVATTCSCTVSDWPKEPLVPGAKAFITLSYNPKGRPGPFNQRITVFSNASGPGVALTIRGQVIPRPKTIEDIYRRRIGDLGLSNTNVSFGVVNVDQIKSDTLKMYNFGTKPVTVSFEIAPKHISISANPQSLNPGKEGEIIFTYNSKGLNEWGYLVSRVQLKIDNKNLPNNIINITARLEEDFSKLTKEELLSAPQIEFAEIQKDFGQVAEGSTVEHEFVFTNKGKRDLIIRKIQASCGCTTVAPKVTVIKPGEKSSLAASFKTNGFTGRQSKNITVITNDPKQSNITLRLTGTVVKQ